MQWPAQRQYLPLFMPQPWSLRGYLIARTHILFLMAPEILHLVAIIGAVTLILAGFAALVQTDIKRVLAYSTMSQIGYMFLALGVQAWDAAIFHLMTHAFFKALLFIRRFSYCCLSP